jgi:hypothetical protein
LFVNHEENIKQINIFFIILLLPLAETLKADNESLNGPAWQSISMTGNGFYFFLLFFIVGCWILF